MNELKLLKTATLATALAFGAATAFAPSAEAAPGGIELAGFVNILPSGPAMSATGFDFDLTVPVPTTTSGLGTGALAGIFDADVDIKDIPVGTLIGTGGVGIVLNINDFFTVDTATPDLFFDLFNVTNIERSNVGLTSITISGAGQFRGGGFLDAPATFTLTAQGNTVTSFSASALSEGFITDVPEPVSLALFGMGLLGLGAVARARRH